MKKVIFADEYVTLNQFLKIAGICYTGGEGKAMILDGEVSVNGEKELRRGKKIRSGDTVTVEGDNETYVAANE